MNRTRGFRYVGRLKYTPGTHIVRRCYGPSLKAYYISIFLIKQHYDEKRARPRRDKTRYEKTPAARLKC